MTNDIPKRDGHVRTYVLPRIEPGLVNALGNYTDATICVLHTNTECTVKLTINSGSSSECEVLYASGSGGPPVVILHYITHTELALGHHTVMYIEGLNDLAQLKYEGFFWIGKPTLEPISPPFKPLSTVR